MDRPPTNKTAAVRPRLDPETRERLSAYAEERRWSISQLVTEWI